MNVVKWARKNVKGDRRSRKGISTIVANLVMLVIVVSLSSILFIWSVSSFGAYTGGAGYWFSSRSIANQERISIENVFFTGSSNNNVNVYVRNVGTIQFTIGSIYVNSTQFTISNSAVGVSQVQPNTVTLTGITLPHGDLQTIKVATLRGTIASTTWVS